MQVEDVYVIRWVDRLGILKVRCTTYDSGNRRNRLHARFTWAGKVYTMQGEGREWFRDLKAAKAEARRILKCRYNSAKRAMDRIEKIMAVHDVPVSSVNDDVLQLVNLQFRWTRTEQMLSTPLIQDDHAYAAISNGSMPS